MSENGSNPLHRYGLRWQVETITSVIKRRLGSALRARSYWSRYRETILRVIAHNVMIVLWIIVFNSARMFLFPLCHPGLT